ncbi:hypothetical protein BFP97_00785 [Roseivirga sp. 4D4]|uniref:hypothetical protein n=1 Tax=Roseivirga sp. 4D4 TaxID=1889784 RepID=UPI0008537FD6|nr:hypothetical protein [Roseivirga sp. 4D4]OEK00138.1 hypothetical protein BFP97_00785 [Roseivirga sp. 4D4]
MKKKLKVLVAFSLLMICMSSCVYSLFPIYTEDTLVFLPELVGKWQSEYDTDDYISFESLGQVEDESITVNQEPSEYVDSMSGNGWSIKSGSPISVTINGKKITDRNAIRAHYDTTIGTGRKPTKFEAAMEPMVQKMEEGMKPLLDSAEKGLAPMLKDLGDGLQKLGESLKKAEEKWKGTVYTTEEESYKMVVMDDGERLVYMAHVVSIGKDYFLDLYPLPEYSDATFGENLFPVHTFMKMDITDGKLNLTMFDLEKLNKLFESNLIRLRHEKVDGQVLITAQPKEIQKFLEKYADDESVFDSVDTYSRATE